MSRTFLNDENGRRRKRFCSAFSSFVVVTKLSDAAEAKEELIKYMRSFESLSACDFVNDELIKEAKANDKLYF